MTVCVDSASGRHLAHRALLYASREEFVEAMAPFVRTGVGRGDLVLVVTDRENAEALREELGAGAAGVRFRRSQEWYTNPATTLERYRTALAERRRGQGATVVGEPTWRASGAGLREWARYESVINVALRDVALDLVCPYDANALPDRVLAHAHETHPELVDAAEARPSPRYVAPAEFPGLLDGAAPVRIVGEASLNGLDGLRDFRRLAAGAALDAGVPPERVSDVVLAASEVASNAVRHGRPPASARVGLSEGAFVCEVSDGGDGIPDPLAGWLHLASGRRGGWGLALARRLADALEIQRDGERSHVRLHFALSRDAEPV